ncbi:hypothetical protein JOC73_001072 [Alkaliphilus hydrothermalis]|uniref:Uncharacterized protein n=1 Tax=Alkaliphilus hydrothermalis TaxID=1482730 RepID=A0ABS2NNQ0_9FIRM|nr:hypothetical protein [Alkaliphilus hydrothermalis]
MKLIKGQYEQVISKELNEELRNNVEDLDVYRK